MDFQIDVRSQLGLRKIIIKNSMYNSINYSANVCKKHSTLMLSSKIVNYVLQVQLHPTFDVHECSPIILSCPMVEWRYVEATKNTDTALTLTTCHRLCTN